MIIGIGVDIVDVRRFETMIFRWKERFLRRVFTDAEIKYCNTKKHPAQRFATRFAAKEAFIKALLPRGQEGISYRDIEIGEHNQRPVINLYGTIKEIAQKYNIAQMHIMLSHDGDYGIANVVLEG